MVGFLAEKRDSPRPSRERLLSTVYRDVPDPESALIKMTQSSFGQDGGAPNTTSSPPGTIRGEPSKWPLRGLYHRNWNFPWAAGQRDFVP